MNPQDKALAEVYRLILEMVTGPEQKEPAAVTAGPCENENPAEDIQSQFDCNINEGNNEQP